MVRALVLGCLLLSGAAGLVHEVAWVRRAALVFGSTTAALSTVLALFFLGLAVGSALFGRVAQQTARPLRWLAAVELGVALLALASPALFDVADTLYGHVYRAAGRAGAAHDLARVALVGAVLLPPSLLMGGALPLGLRSCLSGDARIGSLAGALYAVSTLGAAGGCVLAGYVALPGLGIVGTLAVGAALNGAAATLAGLGSRWEAPRLPVPAAAEPATAAAPRPAAHGWVAPFFFGTGLVALGLEVLWARQLALIVRNTVHTYTLMLALVLVGLVLGAGLAALLVDRLRARTLALGACPIGVALYVTAATALPASFWQGVGAPPVAAAAMLLPAATLSGATLPLAMRLYAREVAGAPGAFGRLLAANTLGGILGSLGVGFLVLPSLGLAASLRVITGLSLALGALAWVRSDAPRRAWAGGLAATALAWLALPLAGGVRVPEDFLAGGRELVGHWEGRTGHVAVVRESGTLQLEIDRWWQGTERRNHQAVAAHVPLLLHPAPRRVLLVGVGAGQTPSRMLAHRELERLDCVDLEPAVFDAIRAHFDASWLDDARVRAVATDGRTHLLHSGERYDVISLELGQVFRPGVAFFYTADFYRRARARLQPGGVLAQFVPLPFLRAADLRAVVGTFTDAFPASVLWYNTSELLLLGFEAGAVRVGGARLERGLADPALRADLDQRRFGPEGRALHEPEVWLSGLLVGPEGLAAIGRGGARARDDRTLLDHATHDVGESETRELETVDLLRAHLAPAAAVLGLDLDPAAAARVAELQRRNVGAIEADALARSVVALGGASPAESGARLARALAANPDDARVHRLLGDTAQLRGDSETAERHYRRALALGAEDAATARGLGVALLARGRPAPAAVHLRRAVALRPEDAGAHNDLGVALAQQGYEGPARAAFEEALRLDPEHADARANLGRLTP